MKKKIKILPAALLLLSSSSYGMNLTQALSSTYETNQDLAVAQQIFLRDIEEFPQALSSFLPDVSAEFSSRTTKSKAYLQPGSQSRESGPSENKLLTVDQTIFSGGSSMFGLQAAQSGFWVSRTKLYNEEQKILSKAIESYLNVAEAKAKYDIAQDSLEFHQRTLHMAEEKLKVGETTITEVSLARSNVARGNYEKSSRYAELQKAKAEFKTVTNLEASDDMHFPELPSNIPENLAEFEGHVLKSNLDLISAKYSAKKSKASANAAKGGLLPQASLRLTAQKSYSKEPLTQKSHALETSLNVKIPIYTKGGSTYSSIRQSNKTARASVYALDQAKKKLKENSVSLWEAYLASKDSIDFTEKQAEYQKLALDGVRQEYEVGAKTMLDVLKTQEDYNKAKVQSVEIRKQYILYSYQIKSLMGKMLARNLKLNVKYFSPEKEFRKIKYKIVGF